MFVYMEYYSYLCNVKREVLPDLRKRRQRLDPEAQYESDRDSGLLAVWIKGKFGDVIRSNPDSLRLRSSGPLPV